MKHMDILESCRRSLPDEGSHALQARCLSAADEIERLRTFLKLAEAALADIGDAERRLGDDIAWCEARAAKALPFVRAALEIK